MTAGALKSNPHNGTSIYSDNKLTLGLLKVAGTLRVPSASESRLRATLTGRVQVRILVGGNLVGWESGGVGIWWGGNLVSTSRSCRRVILLF